MKLKPIAQAIIAAGLVGPAFAAYSGHHVVHKSTCGMPAGMTSVESIITGNSFDSGVDSSVCWHDRVRVSGLIESAYRNVKGLSHSELAAISGVLDEGSSISSVNSKVFDLNQAVLAVHAKLNSTWSGKAVLRYGFANTPINYTTFGVNTNLNHAWTVEEASIIYSNPAQSPLFVKAGRGFVPFGHYANPFEFSPTLIQAYSQLNEEFIQLGVASAAGWNASVAGWTSPVGNNGWRYAANLGFDHTMRGVGLHVDASYISAVEEVTNTASFTHQAVTATTRNNAWQAGVSTNLNGFDLGARYYRESVNSGNIWGLHAGYDMHFAGHNHTLGFDYESASNKLPTVDARWSADYTVGLAKNVDLEFKYTDFSFKSSSTYTVDGGTTTVNDVINNNPDVVKSKTDPRMWTISLIGRF